MGGNALRAAVLGANDGLVANMSLVMGVAGADLAPHAILVTGLAGLLAGAFSMALGEWLSVNTARESAQRQIATEADELEQVPEEEKEELSLIYQAKGLPDDLAKSLAEQLIANKKPRLTPWSGRSWASTPKSSAVRHGRPPAHRFCSSQSARSFRWRRISSWPGCRPSSPACWRAGWLCF